MKKLKNLSELRNLSINALFSERAEVIEQLNNNARNLTQDQMISLEKYLNDISDQISKKVG